MEATQKDAPALGKVEKLAEFRGEHRMILERSYTSRAEELGTHKYTLTLYWYEGTPTTGHGTLEFNIPTLGETNQIGIWTEEGELVDYDGIMGYMPEGSVELLNSVGITVGPEFLDDDAVPSDT